MLGKTALGQTAIIDKKLKLYLQSLKKNNIESYVVVEQGCQGCEIEYAPKPYPDDKVIYVLTEADNKITIQKLEKDKEHLPISLDSTSVFKMLKQRESAFTSQAQFQADAVESEKTLKFVAPHPKYYPYRTIRVNLPSFKSETKVIDQKYDVNGTLITNQKWFKPINEILEHIIRLAQ
ncbi:hypothetical protein GCM10023183_15340 [Nibribacter koreensis]|uniref:Uncharacterized protein n=2 Tax=Nibribacter koreensis TaxID=1084519 RepID=A0ABP8FGD4_9BACT